MLKEYQYNCISPKSLKELEYIIENSKEITYQTFRKNIEKDFIQDFKNR